MPYGTGLIASNGTSSDCKTYQCTSSNNLPTSVVLCGSWSLHAYTSEHAQASQPASWYGLVVARAASGCEL